MRLAISGACRLRHLPMASRITRMVEDLRALGLCSGDLLLVHASLRALGSPRPLPNDVIDALLEAIGPGGTLLMPALSYLQEPREVHDTRHTPSNVGALPECFRLRPLVMRSLHPTHSVCGIGPRAQELLGAHGKDRTPCGRSSPFRKITERDGKILMLGCGLKPNTTMHAIEELVEPPYLYGPERDFRITNILGVTSVHRYRCHDFVGWEQRYDRVATLAAPAILASGKVLEAEAWLLHAPTLRELVVRQLKQDPLVFVDPV